MKVLKKYTVILSGLMMLFFTAFCLAQTKISDFKFDQPYYEAVDKLVLMRTGSEEKFFIGYIYLDQQMGFTLERMGLLVISDDESMKVTETLEELKMALKIRLVNNTGDVAVISSDQKKELNIPDPPEWMAVYKEDEGTVLYMKNIGNQYNGVGASHLALEPLKKAYSIDPKFEDVLYELSFAYNATKQYEKSIELLSTSFEKGNKNISLYKEYGFALAQNNRIEQAEEIYRKALKLTKDDIIRTEISFNMVQAYFKTDNNKKIKYWVKKFKKYAVKGTQMYQFVEYYENEWKKNI